MATQAEKADLIDSIHEHIAYIMIMMSLILGCGLVQEYLGDTGSSWMKYVTWSIIGIIALLAAHLLWLFRAKVKASGSRSLDESFTSHIVHRAVAASWLAGMLSVGMDKRVFSTIPVENPLGFMSESVQAIMFATYGIAFLYLNRDTGDTG